MFKKAISAVAIIALLILGQLAYYNWDLISSIGDRTESTLDLQQASYKDLKPNAEGYVSTTNDPWIEIKSIEKNIETIKIKAFYESPGSMIQVFYKGDKSGDYSENFSFKDYASTGGVNEFYFNIKDNVKDIRVDITNRPDQVVKLDSIILNPTPPFNWNTYQVFYQTLILSLILSLAYLLFFKFNFFIKYRYLLAAVVFIILLIFKVHGSSIGMWNSYIAGGKESSVIFGTDRGIRSDEWLVQTPYLMSQSAEAKIFDYDNPMIRSDGQNMVLTNTATFTPETLGKPFLWGYLLLGVDYGLSWFWFSKLILLLLFSYEICMLLTKRNQKLSVLGSFWISFSPPVQWWFSTTFVELIVYSQAMILCIYYFVKSIQQRKRILLIAGFMLSAIGFVFTIYPGIQVPLGFLTLALIIGIIIDNYKEIKVSKKEWITIGVGTSIIAIVFFSFISNSLDGLKITLRTVYPGDSSSRGGNFSFTELQWYLMNWLLPFKNIEFTNSSEASTFINFLPLLAGSAVLLNKKIIKKNLFMLPLLLYFVFQLSWLFVPYPETIAKLTLFSFVIEGRLAHFVFGLTAVYVSIWFISEVQRNKALTWIQTIMISIFVFLIYAYSINQTDMKAYLGENIIITLLVFVLLNIFVLRRMIKSLAVGISLITIISGLTVNPIASGTDAIFEKPIAKEIQAINQDYSHPKWAAVDSLVNGQYLIALGSKSFNSVHFYPDMKMWETLDPEKKFNDIYNRYAHVMVHLTTDETNFELENPDVVLVNLSVKDLTKTDIKYILAPGDMPSVQNYVTEVYHDNSSGLSIYQVKEVEH